MVLAALWSLVAIGSVAVARADSPAARAKRHNADAEQAFSLGRFEEAISHYEKAYKAKPVAEFLYNLGQCHARLEGLEHLKKARFYFEGYLNNAKEASTAKAVEATIAELDRKIAALKPPPSEHGWQWPVGWVALSVGGASLVTGVVFSVLAKQKTDEYQQAVDQKRPFGELDEIDRTGKQYQTVQIATLVVGGVLAGVGGGLLLWDRLGARRGHESPRPSAHLIPWVTTNGAGLAGGARF
jgi:tetratricopeptide (TPR) repeat protein